MKKEPSPKDMLKDFLERHCEVKYVTVANSNDKNKNYIFYTKDCILFMAEAYIQGMRNAIGQNHAVMQEAKRSSNFGEIIMVYNWSAPEPGIDMIQIPEPLIQKLNQEQTVIFLNNLNKIQKDIAIGRERKEIITKLFSGKAGVETCYALDGNRQFIIRGNTAARQKTTYAERYAEQIATNVLFDLPKALNARLQLVLPEYPNEKIFVEGRSNFNKKVRYGTEVQTELLLTDEGATLLNGIYIKSPGTSMEISILLQQAITDPFGLSLKHYLGRHPLIKLPFGSE